MSVVPESPSAVRSNRSWLKFLWEASVRRHPFACLTIGFWLASMGWMVSREILPRLGVDNAPPFYYGLADEVSGRSGKMITWKVVKDGQEIGTVSTRIQRKPDRTFELTGNFHFNSLKLPLDVKLTKYSSSYRVTTEGDLLGRDDVFTFLLQEKIPVTVRLKGVVEDDQLLLKVSVDGLDLKESPVQLQPVKVPPRGSLLNPMHPQDRIPDLSEGQRWKVPGFQPLSSSLAAGAGFRLEFAYLIAEVSADNLTWQRQEVDCWRIDFAEPGKRPMAQTWVRRSDGLVLQQRAAYQGIELKLIRYVVK